MKNQITDHKSGFSSYRLDTLNDKQRASIFEKFDSSDIVFISIGETKGNKLITRDGKVYKLTFNMVRIVNIEEII